MTIKHNIIAAFVLFAALPTAGAANAAFFTQFDGTRDAIRTACAAPGMDLVEASGATFCIHNNNGITVSCTDAGLCTGAGPLTAVRQQTPADENLITGTVN